jgi:hypothetical protein
MTTYKERERRRPRRNSTRLTGSDRSGAGECISGHPALFADTPAYELGRLPEGGGYPEGFIELAVRAMGCSAAGEILHLCSGSVRAARTIDIREAMRPTICADVRWLPIRPASIRWALADPPYGMDYAEAIWGLGVKYPTPTVLLEECAEVLVDGGVVGYLDQLVPPLPATLELVSVTGLYCGTGTRMRALTVARRRSRAQLLG